MFNLDAALDGLLLSIYDFESLFLIGSQHAALSNQYKRSNSLARGFGSVVKHSTADPGIASSIPPHSN